MEGTTTALAHVALQRQIGRRQRGTLTSLACWCAWALICFLLHCALTAGFTRQVRSVWRKVGVPPTSPHPTFPKGPDPALTNPSHLPGTPRQEATWTQATWHSQRPLVPHATWRAGAFPPSSHLALKTDTCPTHRGSPAWPHVPSCHLARWGPPGLAPLGVLPSAHTTPTNPP